MNLSAIVSAAIGEVNPPQTITIEPSTGYSTNAAGKSTPSFGTPQIVQAQVQPLQYNDLVMTDGMNLQGQRCKIYLQGDWNGIIRADQKGGDRLTLADGTRWLVVIQAENWGGADGWTAVVCTRQNP